MNAREREPSRQAARKHHDQRERIRAARFYNGTPGDPPIAAVVFIPDDGFPPSNGYMVGEDDGRALLSITMRQAVDEWRVCKAHPDCGQSQELACACATAVRERWYAAIESKSFSRDVDESAL